MKDLDILQNLQKLAQEMKWDVALAEHISYTLFNEDYKYGEVNEVAEYLLYMIQKELS